MGIPPTHPALSLPDEIVVQPDRARYQRRFLITGAALAVLVILVAAVSVLTGDAAVRVGAILGGVLATVLGGLSLKWQRDTYLDPEPALVLTRQQFRVLHKGQHLWVPWTDVQEVNVLARGAGLGRTEFVRFDLTPQAQGKLPGGKAPVLDRMFSWATNDLAYGRPADNPSFKDMAVAAVQLHDYATGGHRFRAAQTQGQPTGY